MKPRLSSRIMLGLLTIFMCVMAVLPVLWMLLSSLRPLNEFFKMPQTIFPNVWTLENYADLIRKTSFGTWILNSVIVSFFTILICIIAATLASYSLARFTYKGRKAFVMFSMMSYMMPSVLIVIPMYLSFAKLRLVDNLAGLVISYVALTLPYSIWLLRAFFKSLPFSLEESAAIDGAGTLTILLRIVLPMSLPGLISTSTYAFTYVWNEYLFAAILLSSDAKMTFPVGLKSFVSDLYVRWEYIMTGGILVSIPAIILFLFTQKQLIQGLSAGAVKG